MTPIILSVLALFVLQTLLPPCFRYLFNSDRGDRLRVALGPRDAQPPQSQLGERAQRALLNMHEALPVFLTIALLHQLRGVGEPFAIVGAWIFFGARVAYVPAYLSGVPGIRSLVWGASWVGLILMIRALL